MAIVDMKKLSVVALKDNEKQIVDSLMSMGVVQIDKIDTQNLGEEYEGLLKEDAFKELSSDYDAKLRLTKEAIGALAMRYR